MLEIYKQFLHPHLNIDKQIFETIILITHREKSTSASRFQCPILYFILIGQILCAFYWIFHSFYSKEGGHIGCVGGNHDQSKKPPDPSYQASRRCFRRNL